MNDLGFVAFPAIVVICYLVGAVIKAINFESLDKFIPVICATVGGILAVVVFNTIPGYIPAENWLMALAIGIVSGFASVGINQVYKQFTKVDEEYIDGVAEDEEPVDEDPGKEV